MTPLTVTLAALALAVSAANVVWTRQELRRQRQAADFRWTATQHAARRNHPTKQKS